tara:strand:+ start:2013 stop:2690 length:678 start_codon:yes stop_codon:yes gene_type:complete
MNIGLCQVEFAYGDEDFRLHIPELKLATGSRTAFVGPSGSGKTTLLHLLAGITQPQSGTIQVGENPLHSLSDAGRRAFRIKQIGFVFQDFRLIEYLNVLENIRIPYRLNDAINLTAEVNIRLDSLAKDLQLTDKLDAAIDTLSQGELQRVAIGRALLPQPKLILADEPTGNLDPSSKSKILDLLFAQANANHATLVMVTHDHALLDRFEQVINFEEFHKRETPYA